MKPFEQRSGPEKNFLLKTLKNELFFTKIKEKSEKDVFHKIFNEMRHLFYPKLKIIFKNGDVLKKAMLVLEGEILVLGLKTEKNESVLAKGFNENLMKNKNEFAKFKEYVRSNFQDFQIKEILKAGDCLGLDCLFLEKDLFMYFFHLNFFQNRIFSFEFLSFLNFLISFFLYYILNI